MKKLKESGNGSNSKGPKLTCSYGGSEGRVIRESSTQGSVNQTSSSRKMQNVGQRSTTSYQLVVEEDENLISSQNSKLHGQRDVYSR